jgi:hypothetical protein
MTATMIDWDALACTHWARDPAKLRARGTGLSPALAYDAIARASEPFRLGTRFRAIPDVRFYRGDDQVRSPGTLLPGPADRSLAHYLKRAGKRPFQLVVTHPLTIDFALWSCVRDLLHGLFARVGYPVLPVVSELILGTFACTPRGFTKRLDHAAITVVLAGRLRTRLWRALWARSPNEIRDFDSHPPDTVLEAGAGEVLYWPADRWHLDDAVEPGLALRLWIPVASRRAPSAVKQVITELMAERLGTSTGAPVPYLRYAAGRGAGAAVAPLQRASEVLAELARGPALMRELAILWTRRVSACGLEPAPAPLAISLAPGDRVRRDPRTEIVRMRRCGESIWAMNGHAFALRGRGERALRRIVASIEHRDGRVDVLCGGDANLRAALELLAELRALAVTSAEG